MPVRNFLLFFPLRDGEFYYYRNGSLIENELYWRDQELSNFDSEVELYHRFAVHKKSDMINMFLYFGHEIPEFDGAGYDASYPDRMFTVHNLANALKNLKPDSTKFDLMILSTCYGGSPYTIGSLGSFSKTIIASPDNLHLSYFDSNLLERLNVNLQDGDVPAFAKRFAQESFDRLSKDVQTAVSVTVYDVDKVQKFLHSINETYKLTLNTLKVKSKSSLIRIEHCDCADIPEYTLPSINEGVYVLYRAAMFGKFKNKQTHSGWECWKN
jgi:hypothetical protein